MSEEEKKTYGTVRVNGRTERVLILDRHAHLNNMWWVQPADKPNERWLIEQSNFISVETFVPDGKTT